MQNKIWSAIQDVILVLVAIPYSGDGITNKDYRPDSYLTCHNFLPKIN